MSTAYDGDGELLGGEEDSGDERACYESEKEADIAIGRSNSGPECSLFVGRWLQMDLIVLFGLSGGSLHQNNQYNQYSD